MRAVATILVLISTLVALQPSRAADSAERAGRPNIVLFVTDDQGTDAGCYGNKVLRTPNLDTLAGEGTRFTHAFCTTASCSASRSVILSGLHNHANGQYGHEHAYHHFSSKDNVKSLPMLLGQGGYRTARIGKFHVAPETVHKFDTVLQANPRSPVEMADKCKDLFGEKSDKPFFLYFCTADPHRGGGKAVELPESPDRFGNKPKDAEYPGVKLTKYDPKDVIVPPFLPDTPACRAELAQYYQAISRIDQGLGKLVELLKETGKYDDTLILYISDHGIAFPGAKTTAYDPGLRAPCILRNPLAKKRGVVNDAMISWVDLVPTLMDAAGVEVPRGTKLHGRSFLSVAEEANPKGFDEIFASHTFHEITMYYPMRVVRTRHHKLIWNIAHPLDFPFASDLWEAPTWQDVWKKGTDTLYGKRTVKNYIKRPQFELYDLDKDPDETKNLASDEKSAKLLEELKAKLKDFQKRTDDAWILKWEHE